MRSISIGPKGCRKIEKFQFATAPFRHLSLIPQRFLHGLSADTLFAAAKTSGLTGLDMMEMEVMLYGEKAILKATEKYQTGVDCLISEMPFFTAPEKVESALKASLAKAKRLGAKMLMVVPGSFSKKEQSICSKLSREEMLDRAVTMYRLATDLGKTKGMPIGFENTSHFYKPFADADGIAYVMERVPELAFIFDTANFRVGNVDTDERSVYERLKPYIRRVHLKDVVIGDFRGGERCANGQKIKAVPTGTGVIDLPGLLGLLKADGYDGTLVLEYASSPGIYGKKLADSFSQAVRYINERS